jgi:hypothetical protein
MTSPSVVASTAQNCFRYWDLADSLKIDMIVALWCGVEPSDIAELKGERLSTHCTDAKRAAIEDALYSDRLDYIDEGIPYGDGKIFMGGGVTELAQKDRLRVKKDSLRRWFEDMPIDDRPEFLFEEERTQKEMPDGSEVAEMNSNMGIAIMAQMLAESAGKYKHGERPNAAQITEGINERATEHFGGDKHGLKAFHKKITKALRLLEEQKRQF